MDDARMNAQKQAEKYTIDMVGHVYRHFKGNRYMVINIAVHSETAELLVVYRGNNDEIWVRPLDMFLSPVDKEKYPDVEQEMRFEKL